MKEAPTTLRSTCLIAFLVLFLIVAIPAMVWSYSSNPPLASTGAPGEGTCADCHGDQVGRGNIKVTASGGAYYQPGVKQHLKVTITDPYANIWGYEMTSVRASKPTTGTGLFKATNNFSNVRTQGTKSYAAQINDQQGKTKTATYTIDWIPPQKNVGKITLYLAGIGAYATGESCYKGKLTLSPK